MEKHYCDLCGKELAENYKNMIGQNRVMTERGRLRIVTTISLDGAFGGEVCPDCVLKEIQDTIK